MSSMLSLSPMLRDLINELVLWEEKVGPLGPHNMFLESASVTPVLRVPTSFDGEEYVEVPL